MGMSVGVRLRPLSPVVNGTVVARPARTTVAGPRSVGIRSTLGLPRTCAVTSGGMRTVCEQTVRRVALPGERAADPFGRLRDGWRGRGSVGSAGCTTHGAIQLGGLPAPAGLGPEDPKRVERHAQSPPEYHPNRPECSTAAECPDANQKQVDHHVGEEDTVELLPG